MYRDSMMKRGKQPYIMRVVVETRSVLE